MEIALHVMVQENKKRVNSDMSLPGQRKIWRCGWRWENGEEIDTGKGCGQWICQSLTEKFPSGKYKIKNLKDGRGGKAGEDHKCHNTGFHEVKDPAWAKKYEISQSRLPCTLCGERYNANKMPICPNCFKQQCRSCGALQQWIFGEGIELNKCRTCGHSELDVVETFYARKKLYSNFKTASDI